jgi:hypothetical protein
MGIEAPLYPSRAKAFSAAARIASLGATLLCGVVAVRLSDAEPAFCLDDRVTGYDFRWDGVAALRWIEWSVNKIALILKPG